VVTPAKFHAWIESQLSATTSSTGSTAGGPTG